MAGALVESGHLDRGAHTGRVPRKHVHNRAQAKERGRGQMLPHGLQKNQPCPHLQVRLPASRAVWRPFRWLAPPVCGLGYSGSKKGTRSGERAPARASSPVRGGYICVSSWPSRGVQLLGPAVAQLDVAVQVFCGAMRTYKRRLYGKETAACRVGGPYPTCRRT